MRPAVTTRCYACRPPTRDGTTSLISSRCAAIQAGGHQALFAHYKELEPGKHVEAGDWANHEAAEAEVKRSVERFGAEDH
jgi:hypothetical protein